jgi:hypothetical protein
MLHPISKFCPFYQNVVEIKKNVGRNAGLMVLFLDLGIDSVETIIRNYLQ